MARLAAFDLNALRAPAAAKSSFDWSRQDRGATNGVVHAHLGDIATPLERFLADAESVVGCVAWITSPRLVGALVGKPVSIIVNKEWALRDSDMKAPSVRQRANLARLSGGLSRRDFPAPLSSGVTAANERLDAVRCVGHSPRGRTANNPLMHHKFVVALRAGKPVAVWTGSFNFTVNAESSLENALEVHDPVIAAAYLAEFARVAAVSEPLNFVGGAAAPSWGAGKKAPAVASKAKRARKKASASPTTAAAKTRLRTSSKPGAPKPGARSSTATAKKSATARSTARSPKRASAK